MLLHGVLGKRNWSMPQEIIDRDLALKILSIAELLTKIREVSVEEIELWIQYLKPHWKQGDTARATALFNWDQEMRRRGIVEGGMTMKEFFQGNQGPTRQTTETELTMGIRHKLRVCEQDLKTRKNVRGTPAGFGSA